MGIEPWYSPEYVERATLLCDSFRRWTGRVLVPPSADGRARAAALFHAPHVVVSHGTEPDPLLNYGNEAALRLWELTWTDLIGMPSRLTAEAQGREARALVLDEVDRKGYVDGYSGVRISACGRRFRILDAVIWNVVGAGGALRGQAAMFARWEAI